MDRLPDYSNVYFPPPPSSSGTSTNPSAIYYPPPPERAQPSSTSRTNPGPPAGSTHTPSSSISYLPVNISTPPQIPLRQRAPSSPYQPHASVYQGSPLPSPSLLPPAQHVSRPASPAFRTRFAAVSLHAADRLQFLRFPPALYSLLRATIQAVWTRGIQLEKISTQLLELQLKGNPWGVHRDNPDGLGIGALRNVLDRDSEGQAIHAQRLVCALLRALHSEGWVLMQSTDVSQVLWDADTLLFRHQMPAPAPQEWFSVVFQHNRFRFVDAPRGLCLRVLEHLSSQRLEMKFKDHEKVEGCCEVKFTGMMRRGSPYLDPVINAGTLKTRMMFLDLLGVVEESGWTLYASVEQNMRGDGEGMTDTWYCCRPVGWAEGNPVYHS
ncbi:uncharacterized protein CC84DRAFT_1258198 [Paraphaeosphaeria sporulosa]|uniref:Uncharacterized protein n=1 Tax=Paraphaeosphaeria sporulosa TaxID=1460663 RepID=A0A177CJG5_9PLEO|nr:uncharacterized protein CC84DRAFT_1258198 [Paraphaeosphaeria sporulosa]OAG06979.1 hypothetical protein CC84DRAFT_1258198 [Paraphaeosphaeria sporulosa]